jgi:iron-sulfur cluster repair protein YtfE (RIC family)
MASAAHLPCSACQDADPSEPLLDWRLSVNDFIAMFPQTFPVFMENGVEICCGGSMSVTEATKAFGIPEPELCYALRQAIRAAR